MVCLLIAALLSSVLVPARETWRIMGELREIAEVIEPAHLLATRSEAALAAGHQALEGYARTGDPALLERYRTLAMRLQRNVAALTSLVGQLHGDAPADMSAVQHAISEWQRLAGPVAQRTTAAGGEPEFAATAGQRDAAQEAAAASMEQLQTHLAAAAATRRDEVRDHESFGLLINATLVLVALAAMGTVIVLTARERRLAAELSSLAQERLQLLDEAREGRRQLEQVMASRSQLIRGFTHDVKNPLGAADGHAELLMTGIYGPLEAEQGESVARIRRSLRQALTLIDDLTELARAQSGAIRLSCQRVDLAEMVRGSAEEYRGAAVARGLVLDVDVTADLPALETDRSRVQQILGNLLSNAIKYTERGAVAVRARERTAGPDGRTGRWVAVEVIDTGPGIPADMRQAVFEEFRRLAGEQKPGAGLGLTISRSVARALGGHISLDSEPGEGCTFCLWLPCTPPVAQAPATTVAAPAAVEALSPLARA